MCLYYGHYRKEIEKIITKLTNYYFNKMYKNGYSESDIKVILEQIRLYPDNLSNAFLESGKIIKRSADTISCKYYSDLKFRPEFKAVSVGSKKGFTHNVKNTPRKEGVFPTERKLNKPLWLIQSFLELTEEERTLVIKVLTIK